MTQSITTSFLFAFSFFTLVRSSLQKCKNLFFVDHSAAITNTVALNLSWMKKFLNTFMKTAYKILRADCHQCLYDFFMKILNALPVEIPQLFRYRAINRALMVSQTCLKYSAYHPSFLRDTLYFFHLAFIQSSNLSMVRPRKYINYSYYRPDAP